jgi:hypothetical protein
MKRRLSLGMRPPFSKRMRGDFFETHFFELAFAIRDLESDLGACRYPLIMRQLEAIACPEN